MNNYSSEICEYCPYTRFGLYSVNTGSHNLCEGSKCEEAYIAWQEDHEEDDRTLEELF